MKNRTLKMFSLFMLAVISVPAYANSVLQVWPCDLKEGKTRAELEAVSSAWIKATQSMKGAENVELQLNFPEVAQAAVGHFYFVLSVPSVEQWGIFTGNYAGSPAAKVDQDWNKVATCSGNSLWESVRIE